MAAEAVSRSPFRNGVGQTKRAIATGSKRYESALSKLQGEADKALKAGIYLIVTKAVTLPSGDKQDYMSQAPYFWADPGKKDGLPYIRRDGERNPEINKITDHKSMNDMGSSVENLSLAYYFLSQAAFAAGTAGLYRITENAACRFTGRRSDPKSFRSATCSVG